MRGPSLTDSYHSRTNAGATVELLTPLSWMRRAASRYRAGAEREVRRWRALIRGDPEREDRRWL